MRVVILAVLLVTGIQLATGAVRQCYSCLDKGCGDPFDTNAGATKAPSTNGWCFKFKGEKDGKTFVDRLPDPGKCSANKCEQQTFEGLTGTLCCCDKDLCNASPRSISTIGITFTAFFLFISFFAKFY